MNNYEYVEIARKLSENDDRKNLITGLVITTIIMGGITYLQYLSIKSQKEQSLRLSKEKDRIKEDNLRKSQQSSRLIFEKFTLQEAIKQLKEKNELLAKKIKESDVEKNNA
jgi:hypothetical protein